MNGSEHTDKFYLKNYFFNGPFEHGDDAIFNLLRSMKKCHLSALGQKILYADRSLEDELLLIRPVL
jgi:hypothetical protein